MGASDLDRHTDQALHAIELVLNASGQGVVLLDDHAQVLYSNPAADELLKIEPDPGAAGARRITAKLIHENGQPLLSLLDLNERSLPAMLSIDGNTGRKMKVSGVPLRHVFILQPVADAVAQEDAERELLDIIAHDLRAGLVPAKTYAQMLMTGACGPVTEKQSDSLKAIDACIQKQADKITSLLDMVKAEENRLELQLETVSLADIINRAIDYAQRDIKRRGVDFHADIDTRVALVEADTGRLQRIILSLILHGIKQSPKGGALGVDLKILPDKRARLRIWNTGSGNVPGALDFLTKSCLQQAEDRRRNFKAPDIDLAATYDIVRLHGGSIQVSTEFNAGTTYTIFLPVTTKSFSVRQTQEAARALVSMPPSPERDRITDAVRAEGFDVTAVDDAFHALRSVRQFSFNLALLSQAAPSPDFSRVLNAIQQERSDENLCICVLGQKTDATNPQMRYIQNYSDIDTLRRVIADIKKETAAIPQR